ncbi:hypothetical protein QE250_16900, partial [Chromatiaceae bacterium AAb-1]|nr:hypothetical protein [Chromatiaceae bacterium AAb-1]
MFKQSYVFLSLQLLNVSLGFFVTIYLAIKLEVEVFAVFVIYSIITSVITAFSFTGIEAVLIRNALSWQHSDRKKRIKLYMSQAMSLRLFMIIVMLPLLTIYAFYISRTMFDSKNLLL